jgi:hypothetical protein
VRSIGQRGELLVAERLLEQDWSIAHPLSDTSPFDLIAAKGDRFLRIQVKATLKQHSYPSSRRHYQFQLAKGLSSKKRYTKGEVDFFVCCALDSHRFWVIPLAEVGTLTLKIYSGTGGKFHQFENAWVLLEK